MADIETLAATKRTHAEGAAPATPSAAEVVIYAKSDGLMYSKDDAGAETLMSSGAALSNPMTTAEDIIKGGASGTPGRVALGASNTALASSNSTLAYVPLGTKAFAPDSLGASSAPTAANDFTQGWRRGSRWIDTVTDKEYVCLDETTGAAVWTETTGAGGGSGLDTGTTFPDSPTTGDRYRRSDLDYMVFFYDGTRWVTEQLFTINANSRFDAEVNMTATKADLIGPSTRGGTLGVLLVRMDFNAYVGTTNDGSKYWEAVLSTTPVGSPTWTQRMICSTVGAAPNEYITYTDATAVAISAADAQLLRVSYTKVSTPGGLYPSLTIYYRLIAT